MRVGIRGKLLAGFGSVLVLLGLVGMVGMLGLAEVSSLSTQLYEKHTLGIEHLMQANIDLIASGRAEYDAILSHDKARIETYAATSRKLLAAAREEVHCFSTLVEQPEAKRQLADLDHALGELATATRSARFGPLPTPWPRPRDSSAQARPRPASPSSKSPLRSSRSRLARSTSQKPSTPPISQSGSS